MGISNTDGTTMKRSQQPAPGGPDAQWSADGQWWWDGDVWTQMWQPPRGLSWDGQTWVRASEAPVFALHPAEPEPEREPEPEPERQVYISPRESGSPRSRPRRRARRQAEDRRQARTPNNPPASSPVRFAAPRFVPEQPRTAPRSGEVVPAPPAASPPQVVLAPPSRPAHPVYAQVASNLQRIPNRMTWLVAAAMVLVVAGIFSVVFAISLGRSSGDPGSSQASGIGTVRLTPIQIAKALAGRQFTRDVVPLELADAAPLHDVFVAGSVPGLVGETSTTTSDLGGNVTFYVFADQAWAEAFFENPPTAFGCGVCTSMGDATPVQGVGDRATSHVLYRKKVGGQSWIATTTYVLSGLVVVDGLYFPVNVANPSPSATDLAVATDFTKTRLQPFK